MNDRNFTACQNHTIVDNMQQVESKFWKAVKATNTTLFDHYIYS